MKGQLPIKINIHYLVLWQMPQDSKRTTRAAKRKAVTRSETQIEVLGTTQSVIESSGEGNQELVIPKISEDSKMEEAIKKLGELMIQNTNEQMQMMREREEANLERFKPLLENQSKCHRQDTENLAE